MSFEISMAVINRVINPVLTYAVVYGVVIDVLMKNNGIMKVLQGYDGKFLIS